MKRSTLLLLQGLLVLVLNISSEASARLFEARLMGVDEETATLVELGEFEEAKMCLPMEKELSDEAQKLATEPELSASSGPMF